MDLIELGVKPEVNCDDCEQPLVEHENEVVLDIYSIGPIWVTDFGAIGIDIPSVICLLDEMEIENKRKRLGIIQRVILYHNELQKKKVKENGSG